MWATLFAVAVAPLLISLVVAALVTCFYFACVKKEGDQIRRGWMRAQRQRWVLSCSPIIDLPEAGVIRSLPSLAFALLTRPLGNSASDERLMRAFLARVADHEKRSRE